MRFSILLALVAFGAAQAQQTMRLTLADAQRPGDPEQSAVLRGEVHRRRREPGSPSIQGSSCNRTSPATSPLLGADNGSRIAAGGLTNPVIYDRLGSGLTISQLVTDFGRTSNLIGMAKLQAAAQDQVTEGTRADILLATSSAYFAVLSAQSVLKVVDETVKARQTVVDQVTALVEIAKKKSTLNLSFANVNCCRQAPSGTGPERTKAAEARLATAMGLPGEQAFVLAEEPMPSAIPDRTQDLIDAAIQNRPELKDLRLQQSAAERLAKAEHACFSQRRRVGGRRFAPAAVAQIPGRYGAIGMNISVPIFNGGLFRARQTEAELKAGRRRKRQRSAEPRLPRCPHCLVERHHRV